MTPSPKHATGRPRLPRAALLMPAALLIAACDGGGNNWDSSTDNYNNAAADYEAMSARYAGVRDTGRPSNVSVDSGIFLANKGFRSGRGNPLPARFETAAGVTINTASPINIEEFAQIVEQMTGIRVDYEDLRMIGAASTSGASGGGAQGDSAQTITALVSRAQSTTVGPTDRTFRIRHTGKLSTVLDTVASRMAADWVYEGGRIVFKGPQTMTYTIWAFPGSASTTGSVGGGDSSFGSGSSASTSSTAEFNYWSGVEQSLSSLIPNGLGAFTANPASGTITVTGSQAVHLRVQDFIENENRRLSRQVAVRIDVIALTRNSADNRGLSLEGVLRASGGGSLAVGLLGGTDGAGISLTDNNGSAAINLLSSYGQVAIVQTQTVTAMNNTPTPVSITQERAYVASTSIDQESGATEITPGLINSGVNFVVTPRIMSSNEVVLQYTLNMSELLEVREFSSGTSSVQLPEMSSRNFAQTVNIRSGQTVVIGTSDTQNSQQRRQGAFNPSFWGLGGERKHSVDGTRILILMTPVVLEGNNTPQVRR